MAKKKALITGLGGFTGYYMAMELEAAGYEVHGTGSDVSDLPNYHRADLLDISSLKSVLERVRPSVLVHLAGIAFVGHGNVDAFYKVNLMGTRNLLDVCSGIADGLDCVLLASSANVYGNRTEGVISEDVLPDPANDYAVSKIAMEYVARIWMPRLPIVIARPFNYTGVGQSENFLLPKVVGHFLRGASRIELGNLDVWRDFNDVRSVVSAYRGLIEAVSRTAGQTFNVCSGRATSLREVIALMAGIAGYPIEVAVNPAFVRANEVKTLTGSFQRLSGVLPEWYPLPLEETLTWMFRA